MKKLIYTQTFENKDVLKNIFIPRDTNWKSTEEDNLSIIESGKKKVLFRKIITCIETAETLICLQSFLIQNTAIIDALVKASKRGVRVFVMDASEARMGEAIDEEKSFITTDYIKMLQDKFKNRFVHRQARNLHAKFILIDPKTNAKGYLFTGNFNKKPFFENPELGILLSKAQIEELYKVFVYHFWEQTKDEQTVSNQFDKVKPLDKFILPPLNEVLITTPNKEACNLKTSLLSAINQAKIKIELSTFGLDIKHEVAASILDKLKKGLDVTIYARPREKAIKENIEILAKNGAKVICHPLIHAKSLCIDNKKAFVFTANFEEHGMDSGFEVGLELNENQKKDLNKIYTNWNTTFPLEYIAERKLININFYKEFNNKGRLSEKIDIKDLAEDKKTTLKVRNVTDLKSLLNNKVPNFKSKVFKIHKAFSLETIDNFEEKEQLSKGLFKAKKKTVHKNNKKEKTSIEDILIIDKDKVQDIKGMITFISKNIEKNLKIYAK